VNPLLEAAQGGLEVLDAVAVGIVEQRQVEQSINTLRAAIASATEREAAVERLIEAVDKAGGLFTHRPSNALGSLNEAMWDLIARLDKLAAVEERAALSQEVKHDA
jgi:hypothetical protein